MAKKKELSLEEKLENALVPSWEQPYPVPKNWVWVRLQSVCTETITDGTHQTPKYSTETEGMPFVSAKDITKTYIDWSKIKYITTDLHQELYKRVAPKVGDVLLAKNGTTGVAAIVETEKEFSIYVTIALLRPNLKCMLAYFLFRLINSPIAKEQFDQHLTGIGVPNLHLRDIRETKIPLPPLAEQERIVNRIESLFEKLDKAQELIENALDSFDNRKSALLHQAFTGELTKKWREENGVSFESWEENKVDSVSTLITKGASPRWQGIEYTSDKSQTLFVTSENVREGYLDFIKEKYLDNKINEIQKRSVLKSGDVLLNIVGASIGRSAIFNLDVLANTNQAVAIIRVNANVYNVFLSIYLNSPVAQDYYSYTKVDVARANISLGDIKNMPILLPSLPEQKEIVRILDSILEKEEKAKLQAQKSLEHIKQMKKAILARAFRGELGTNDEKEESAIKLLKEVLGEKDNEEKPKREYKQQIKIPKEIKGKLRSPIEIDVYQLLLQKEKTQLDELLLLRKGALDVLQALNRMEQAELIYKEDTSYFIRG